MKVRDKLVFKCQKVFILITQLNSKKNYRFSVVITFHFEENESWAHNNFHISWYEIFSPGWAKKAICSCWLSEWITLVSFLLKIGKEWYLYTLWTNIYLLWIGDFHKKLKYADISIDFGFLNRVQKTWRVSQNKHQEAKKFIF